MFYFADESTVDAFLQDGANLRKWVLLWGVAVVAVVMGFVCTFGLWVTLAATAVLVLFVVGLALVANFDFYGPSSVYRTCAPQQLPGEVEPPQDDRSVVHSREYYAEYHGHQVEDLVVIERALRTHSREGGEGVEGDDQRVVFLAGDSTLDNKCWFFNGAPDLTDPSYSVPAVGGYELVLRPPRMVKDVCYWVNRIALEEGVNLGCINAAIEESNLSDRSQGKRLLQQDMFIQRHLRPQDVLVISVGGNDVALRPRPRVILSLMLLTLCTPTWFLRRFGWGPGIGHLATVYGAWTAEYLANLTRLTNPRLVVVCMTYYPAEKPKSASSEPSWADPILRFMGYDAHPEKLQPYYRPHQLIMRIAFERGTCKVRKNGVAVIPLPLYDVLDAKTTEDYVQRVEPSMQGGEKMARRLLRIISKGAAEL